MRRTEVLAVVVSYNGREKISRGVSALREQVGHVLIVDNGSASESLTVLEALERDPRVSVERLGENRGVSHALNRGIACARAMGFSWLLTMDQDSVIDSAFMSAYEAAVDTRPAMACLAPAISRDGTSEAEDGVIGYAITSGNLVRLDVYDAIGSYDEKLFIDGIDFDFSLRVREAGFAIRRVRNALMRHWVGEATDLPVPLRRFYTQHPAVRRYYMSRNFLRLAARHFKHFPAFIIKLALAHVVQVVLIGVYDPAPRESYRAIRSGIKDYFAGIDGPFVQGDK